MGTIAIDKINPSNPPGALVIYKWVNMENGDDGAILEFPKLADKTVQVYGTFGSGGTIILEGANDVSGFTWSPLSDPLGNPIEFTSAGMKQLLENPFVIRPRVTGGDGTTSLTVVILCRG